MKKFIALITASMLALTMLSGCGSAADNASGEASAPAESVNVAIAQFAPHGSLDNCVEGFKLGMEEAGYVEGENVTYDLQNAQADMANANQIAQSMAAAKPDLIGKLSGNGI